MTSIEPIKITGLAEFSRNLRKLDSDLPKGLRLASNQAGKLIVDWAVPRVPIGPGRGGHAASSIKTKSTRTEARVSGGGKRYPYYPWLDFGGRVGRRRSVKRPFMRSGRYIYEGYAQRYEDVQAALLKALLDVARDAGVEVD